MRWRDADLFPLWKSHHAHRHIVGQFTFSFKVSDLHFLRQLHIVPRLPGLAPWESGYMLKSTPLPLGTTICPQKLTITLEEAFQAGGICSCTTQSGVHIHGSEGSEANLQWICLPTCCTVHLNRKKQCSWKSGPSSCQVNCGNNCFSSSQKLSLLAGLKVETTALILAKKTMPLLPGRIVITTYWVLAKNHALLDILVVATTRCILIRNCTLLACWVSNGFQSRSRSTGMWYVGLF